MLSSLVHEDALATYDIKLHGKWYTELVDNKGTRNVWLNQSATRHHWAYRYSPHNDISAIDGPHIRLSSHKIMIQGQSLARGPKLLYIKNYVIEIMTWKFINTYRERCKTRPVHNRCWNRSPFTSKHTGMRFSKFWNTFPRVSKLTAWISLRIASLNCSTVWGVFLYTVPFSRPPKKEVGRLPLVS